MIKENWASTLSSNTLPPLNFFSTLYLSGSLKVKVAESWPTFCDHMNYTVHGVLQARIQELVAVPFSRGSSQPRDQTQVSLIAGGFFISWTTREAQEYWSGQPIPSPADLPDPGIEPGSPALHVASLPAELSGKPICLSKRNYIHLH